ncbi:MAG: lysyl-tRNA synthetase [Nostocoides sp.]
MINTIWPYAAALIPFIGAAFIFYVIIKGVLEGDRRERIAQRKWDEEHGTADHLSGRDNGGPQ